MKRLSTTLLCAVAVGAIGTPALACDFHNGPYSQLSGANWQSYSPRVSTTDPALFGMEETGYQTPVTPKAKAALRPSFSDVASRASKSALERRAKAKAEADVKTAAAKTTPSGADGQAVRN